MKTGKTPKVGAIISWSKGKKHNTKDGAGHVEVVEKVIDKNTIYTSSSGYGGPAFWNSTRKNTNGRWGTGSSLHFEGFIYLPDDVQKKIDGGEPTPEPTPSGKYKIGDSVIVSGPLYLRANDTKAVTTISNKHTKITRYIEGAKHPYNFTGDLGWADEKSITPEGSSTNFKVGDKVVITGKYASSANATSAKYSTAIGKERYIVKIYSKAKYPYQLGVKANNTSSANTTGFADKNSIRKK